MRGLRLYSVALVCMVGLLGGCTHTTEVGVNRSGKTVYLKTTCMPAFTIISGLAGLTIVGDAPETYLASVAGGALVDFLRCGLVPPKANSADNREQESKDASGPKKYEVDKAIAGADGKCLAKKCGHLYSTTDLPIKYNKCIVIEAAGECKRTN